MPRARIRLGSPDPQTGASRTPIIICGAATRFWPPLANPSRRGTGRLIVTADRAQEIEDGRLNHGHKIEVMDNQALTRMLPAGAVHQGMVFKVQPLEGVTLDELADPANGVIVMLDQLTDPQNVGAIFRSALAFGARGIIVQDRHAPALAGALAKAAVGATERLPHARVTNLSRALERLADLGWRAVGLDGSGEQTLEEALDFAADRPGHGVGGRRHPPAGGRTLRRAGQNPHARRFREPERVERRRRGAL